MVNWRKTLLGLLIGASTFLSPSISQAETETVFSETYPIILRDREGNRRSRINTKVDLNKEEKSLRFCITTPDYNKTGWTIREEAIPLQFRYTLIHPPNLYISHPEEVKISGLGQIAHIVSPIYNETKSLVPIENSWEEKTRDLLRWIFVSGADKIGAGKLLDAIIDTSVERYRRKIEDNVRDLSDENVFTEIPPYVANILGNYNETARCHDIQFDTGNLQGEIPIILWARLNVPYLSDKQEKLEDIVVNFNLGEEIVDIDEIKRKICTELNRTKCNFEEIDLNDGGRNELIITYPEGNRTFAIKIFRINDNDYTRIFRGSMTSLEISDEKTRGYRNIIDKSVVYQDESIPSCTPMVDRPRGKAVYRWNGKEYVFGEIIKTTTYSGRITHEDCEERRRPSESISKESKKFEVCINHNPRVDRRRDGRTALQEVIFYVREDCGKWIEFDRTQDACADKPVILENPGLVLEIRARGYYDNGIGNKWRTYFGSDENSISQNTRERRIVLRQGRRLSL